MTIEHLMGLLAFIAVELGIIANYAYKVSRKLDYIYLHLKGIETKEITSISSVPESMSRSDEVEAAICEARNKAAKIYDKEV